MRSSKLCLFLVCSMTIAPAASGQDVAADTVQTATGRDTLSSEFYRWLPVRFVEDWLSLQNGVVFDRPTTQTGVGVPSLYVRGGRASETGYFLDGIDITNPFTRSKSMTISSHGIGDIHFLPGSYPVNYGNYNSAIVGISSMQGRSQYSAMVEGVSDDLLGSNFDQNWYTSRLSGPIPGLSNGRFMALSERRSFRDREPSPVTDFILPDNSGRLPSNWLKGWSHQMRLDYPLSDNLNLSATGAHSIDEWQQYSHNYFFDIEHSPYYKDKNLVIGGQLTYRPNEKIRYHFSASLFSSERFRGDGLYREDLLSYGQPGGNPRLEEQALFYATGHVWDDYLRHKASWYGLSGAVEVKPAPQHTVTLGFDARRYTLRLYNHLFPARIRLDANGDPTFYTNGFLTGDWTDVNRYGYDLLGNESDEAHDFRNRVKHPKDLAAYIQDHFVWRNLTVTAGLRLDRFDYDALRVIDPAQPFNPNSSQSGSPDAYTLGENDLEQAPIATRWSPRLSVSFTPLEHLSFQFALGRLYQRPAFGSLYTGWTYFEHKLNLGGYFSPFGNASLSPVRTFYVEGGVALSSPAQTEVRAIAFYRKASDLVLTISRSASPTQYTSFYSTGEAAAKGLTLILQTRRNSITSVDVAYTFQHLTGSVPPDNRNIAWTNDTTPSQSSKLSFDRPHSIVADIALTVPHRPGCHVAFVETS